MRLSPSRIRRWAVLPLAVLIGGVLAAPSGAQAANIADAADTPRLSWVDCQDGFQCATAKVPLDYDQPRGEKIDLAVIKLPASDPSRRIGTLFVNFGGPGPSGVERLRERGRFPWLFSDVLRSRFDLVAWDSRSVARSAAARCFATLAEQQAFFGSFPEMPGDPSGEADFYAKSKELADRCAEQAGPIIDHASTTNTARDLDLLRRAVGDRKLTYHGISYGTQLGAIYANLFPDRIRAMAFDGSMDFEGNINGHGSEGTTKPLDTRQDVPRGIADTFDKFLTDCKAAGPNCAFSSGDPEAKWVTLAEKARSEPIVVDGQAWTYSAIINTAGDLSQPTGYPDLAVLLQKLYDAATGTATTSAATTAGGEPYLTNRTEAFFTIQCSDSVFPTDTAIYSRAAVSEDKRVPYFGRIGVFDMMSCAFWSGRDTDRYTGPWNKPTSAPILVLNTRFDPSTPLHGAYDGAEQLARARVLEIDGAGHTTMFVRSTCAEQAKREYLIRGVLPPAGATCGIDNPPFG